MTVYICRECEGYPCFVQNLKHIPTDCIAGKPSAVWEAIPPPERMQRITINPRTLAEAFTGMN